MKERLEAGERFQINELYQQFLEGLTDEQLKAVREDLGFFQTHYFNNAKNSGTRVAVEGYYIAIDKLQQEALSDLQDKEISCKKGCGYCCHIHVDVTSHEAEVILERCKEEGISIDWLRLKKQSIRNLDTWKNLSMKYRRCVFLSDDNQCKIYSFRPATCRNMLSMDDPIKCKNYDGGILHFFARHPETIGVAVYNAVGGGTLAAELVKLKGN